MKKKTKTKLSRKEKTPRRGSKADSSGRKSRSSRRRKWLARLLAVVLAPLLFLTIAELGLWLFGYGYDTSYFIKAEDGQAYLSNPKFTQRFFGPELSRTPIPTLILASKPENTYRVFVFGGSAAQGVPDPAFSFSRILEAMLNDRYSQTRFEVINTATVAINSHVVLPIVKECGGFDGDLFIVYLGNNEVVGPYGAGTVFESPCSSLSLIRASIYVRSTRLGQLMGNTIRAVAGGDAQPRKEWGGMEMFLNHRVSADDPQMNVVYDNFTANLRDICAEARDAGVPVIVSTVLTNLKDCPPFHSIHRPGISAADTALWEEFYKRATALQESGDHPQAVREYLAAEEIDDQFAELYFRLGQCCLALEQFDLARQHFVRARDLDALRFRADTRINQIIRQVAGNREAQGVYLLDAQKAASAHGPTPHGTPGSELLHEHVHLNFQGNYVLAAGMFEKVAGLLPRRIRHSVQGNTQPPSLERCAKLTAYTKFNQLFDAARIAQITLDPPFPKSHGQRSIAEAKRIEAQLAPEVLSEIAQDYRQALSRRPDDLLLRETFAQLQSVREEYASAAEQYRMLIGRYPHCTNWHHELGVALADQGKTSEAIAKFRSVLKLEPYHVETHTSLASALVETGKVDEAIEEYRTALSIRPKHSEADFELGRIFLRRDQPEQAEKHLTAAIEADPNAPRFHFFLGRALAKQNKVDRAIEEYRNEVSVFPKNPLPHLELARILLARNQPDQTEQAVHHYRRAIELDPKLIPALNNLAWIYATNPSAHLRNGNRAVILAERASGLLDQVAPPILDTLAAAYAEAGQFDQAVETARKAIALAEQAGDTSLAGQIRSRLNLYLAAKPFREPAP